MQVDTNGNNPASARIATTNGAVMLDNAAANPALDAAQRDAARALAAAYLKTTAMGNRDVASDADFHAALDDLIAKDAAMKKVCGNRWLPATGRTGSARGQTVAISAHLFLGLLPKGGYASNRAQLCRNGFGDCHGEGDLPPQRFLPHY